MTEATAKVVNCILAVDIIYLESKKVELVYVLRSGGLSSVAENECGRQSLVVLKNVDGWERSFEIWVGAR